VTIILEKRPLTLKFSKIFKKLLSSRRRSTLLCSNVEKFGRRDIGEIVRYLVDKKQFRLPLKLSLLRGSRPKSARASAQQRTQGALGFIQIGSLSAEL